MYRVLWRIQIQASALASYHMGCFQLIKVTLYLCIAHLFNLFEEVVAQCQLLISRAIRRLPWLHSLDCQSSQFPGYFFRRREGLLWISLYRQLQELLWEEERRRNRWGGHRKKDILILKLSVCIVPLWMEFTVRGFILHRSLSAQTWTDISRKAKKTFSLPLLRYFILFLVLNNCKTGTRSQQTFDSTVSSASMLMALDNQDVGVGDIAKTDMMAFVAVWWLL